MRYEPDSLDPVVLPEAANGSCPPAGEVFQLLRTRFLRLRIVLGLTAAVGLGCAIGALLAALWLWAILLYTVAMGFYVLAMLAIPKYKLVSHIQQAPEIVYWAYASKVVRPLIGSKKMVQNFLTLHCRTGVSLELLLSPQQIASLVIWLKHQNGDLRVGVYDDLPAK